MEMLATHSDTLLAALVGLVIGVVKLVEVIIRRLWERHHTKNGNASKLRPIVSLDSETSRLISDTYDQTNAVAGVILLKDQNGTPMVYFPRGVLDEVKNIALVLRDAASSQERAVAVLERIEAKVDDNRFDLKILVERARK